jgi:hypothetical protein
MIRRLTPTPWHVEFRTIERYLFNIRLLQESSKRLDIKGLVREAVEGFEKFSEESERYFFTTIRQSILVDIERSNKGMDKLEPDTLPYLAELAERSEEDVIETPPIARAGHFTYALLDILHQGLRRKMWSGASWFNKMINLSLDVVRVANHSFLRQKALEVLHAVGRVDEIGLNKIERELEQASRANGATVNARKAYTKWRDVKRYEAQMDAFNEQLQPIILEASQREQVCSLLTVLM